MTAPTGDVVGARVAVAVAPLDLPGLTDALYTLTVHAGPAGTGEVVWSRQLTSVQYGDGAGSLAYVGPCDADAGTNSVTLVLDALYDATGALPAASWQNPTPVTRDLLCLPDADAALDFDMTIARRATQGFFDVAVSFDDIFCAAKLDCEDPDTHADLDLLHAPGGARDLTVVLGFACTGAVAGPTYLYMDNPVVTCAGLTADVVVDVAGQGLVDLGAAPSANDDGYLFAASVFRGAEQLASKAYWNVSFGLDATGFTTAGACTLSGRATASATPWPQQIGGFPLPPGAVYPVIVWSVPLSTATGRACTTHPLDGADGRVATTYLGWLPAPNQLVWATDPIKLRYRYEPATGQVLGPIGPGDCDPACQHGGLCVAVDTCVCLAGWTGPACATAVCDPPCENGGSCTAPDTCACLAGFSGDRCQITVPPPTADITATPASGYAPLSTTIAWTSTNAATTTVSGPGVSSSAPSGSVPVAGLAVGVHSYTINVSNAAGTAQDTVAVSVTPSPTAKFVAVAHDSNKAAYSTNGGSTWSAATLPLTAKWQDVVYGGGKFVAVAEDINKVAYSTNGVNWLAANLPTTRRWFRAAYGGGRFVVIAIDTNGTNTFVHSADGVTWASGAFPRSSSWDAIGYGGGRFIAVDGWEYGVTSTNGVNWTETAYVGLNYPFGVAYGAGKFLVTPGNNYSSGRYTTNGGTSWLSFTMVQVGYWNRVVYGNNKFVAVMRAQHNLVARSTTGTSGWATSTLPWWDYWFGLGFGAGRFVAVAAGVGSTRAAWSTDGATWTGATLPSPAYWYAVTYGE